MSPERGAAGGWGDPLGQHSQRDKLQPNEARSGAAQLCRGSIDLKGFPAGRKTSSQHFEKSESSPRPLSAFEVQVLNDGSRLKEVHGGHDAFPEFLLARPGMAPHGASPAWRRSPRRG